MNYIIGLLCILQLKISQCIFSRKMNPSYQKETEELDINDQYFISNPDYVISYGVWSQYTPLSQIVQVGYTGLFDSNCFHLHTAADKKTNRINFIYYDCLDYNLQIITKNIRFRDDLNAEHTIVVNIDKNLYEYTWYYFVIATWPQINRCIIVIRGKENSLLFKQELQIKYPYFDKTLLLTFGGDGISFDGTTMYSYFPGRMSFFLELKSMPEQDIDKNYRWDICLCIPNEESNIIQNRYFKENENVIFVSQHANCDYFQFAGWIKLSEIISDNSDFNFQLLKITKNTQNIKLTDDNLSPFCLTYRISNSQVQILITTYSFTYPTVNVYILQNPFLIPIIFNVNNIMNLWHFVQVILQENQLQITIVLYQGVQQHQFSKALEVNQFHIVNFQVQIGDLNGKLDNYINFQISQAKLFNCGSASVIQGCHSNCETCDGPTSTDCLTCPTNSDRSYLQTTKQCICPLDSIDQGQCLKIKNLKLKIISKVDDQQKCNFGYFEINSQCYQCPQTTSDSQINCIECLINPKTWSNMLYCQQSIISRNGNSYEPIFGSISYYVLSEFIGIDICEYCGSNCVSDQCKEDRYVQKQQQTALFCSSETNNLCYSCDLQNCDTCIIAASKLVCVQCNWMSNLVAGNCISIFQLGNPKFCIENCAYCQQQVCQQCLLPYYLSSDKSTCKLCSIQNCKYCFEFLTNDFSRSTLQKRFLPFDLNEYWKLGCSQCNQGFNYDFTIEKCVFGGIGIPNCLRSYTDILGKEICLLSAVDDFDIAPEIINCELHIPHCKQCLLTPSQIIQCLICADGYTASTITGLCDSFCSLEYSAYCIEGDYQLQDYWMQFIQSFLIQFLPSGYLYPPSDNYLLLPFPVCITGYRINTIGKCQKDCDQRCLECKEDQQYEFICQTCPSTYYDWPNLSEDAGSCLSCPLLCASCWPRTPKEISALNPYFASTSANMIYTQKCLRAIRSENVQLDSETQIASYCFGPDCSILEYQFDQTCNDFQQTSVHNKYDSDLLTIYCNEKGIKTLSFKISYKIASPCFTSYLKLTTNLKSQVFSMQNIHFSLIGQKEQSKLQNSIQAFNFNLSNYDQVKLQYFILNIKSGSQIKLDNGNLPISFLLMDSVIFTDFNQATQFRFDISKYQDLLLQNLTLLNLYISNVTLLNYFTELNEKQIVISRLHINNCTFFNSTLFLFTQYSQSINISQIDIQNSTFVFSKLVQYQYRAITDQVSSISIFINSSSIQHSTIISNRGNQIVYISDIQLYNTDITHSIIIDTDLSATCIKARISFSQFISSIFFRAIQQSNQQNSTFYLFSDFLIQKTDFSNTTLFMIHQEINPVDIQFNNILIQNIAYLSVLVQQIYLCDIQCEKVSINNFSIVDSQNINFFQIYKTKDISFSNIRYENSNQLQKILPTSQCYSQFTSYSILMQIQGFFTLQFTNVSIINQFSIDNSFIQIFSDLLYYPNHNEIITLINLQYFGNILLKHKIGNMLSLLVIFSDKLQNIELKNIEFQENFFHQFIDDPSQRAASLLFIDSQQSSVIIEALSCTSNGITNSFYSFMVINSYFQKFNNFNITNSNFMSNDIWLKYYSIGDINYFDNINLLISQAFRISNSGGVGSLQSSQIMISNSFFQNILASSSSGFNIITQGMGIVELDNITIVKVSALLIQTSLPDGCITIISKNSLLNLKITNIIFQEVHNWMGSTIFTIIPSLKQNSIHFANFSIVDCFSLINQVISIEFSQDSIRQNKLMINNLSVIQSEVGLAKYLQRITFPRGPEINKIKSESALFNLKCCSLILDNCYFTGILISPIFILTDIEMLILTKVFFDSLLVLYPLRILQFQLTTQISHQLVFRSISFQSISQMNSPNNLYNTLSELTSISYNYANCRANVILGKSNLQNNTLHFFIDSFNQQFQQQGAIAVVNDLSNLSKVHLSQINIFNNNCSFCYEGLFVIQQQLLASITILESNCYSNYITQFGCFYFINNQLSSNNLFNLLSIKDSVYINNNGTKGVGIFSQNTLFKIIRCRFFFNNASEEGGAIFTSNLSQNFSISNTQIVQNYANIGGGISFGGKNHLSSENSIQCLIVFNKAKIYSNNLFEAPDHLALKINFMEMNSKILHEANISMDTLFLQPYNQIEQGKPIRTNYLLLPSNQQISSYKRFNLKKQLFESYITQISLQYKNSLQEILVGDATDQCTVQNRKYNESSQQALDKLSQLFSIGFDSVNNEFQLKNMTLSFNPYINNDIVLQLYFSCQSLNKLDNLTYQLKVRSFKCQLGEFYANDGCQICEPTFGFYSVIYDAKSCSIFDKTKFDNITSNQIQLKNGFWRPDHQSDQTEKCFKNLNWCIGGWDVNNNLCYEGHIGGLCEECDIYNIRGTGKYFKSNNTICSICNNGSSTIVPFIFITLWSFISILLTLNSIRNTNKMFGISKVRTKLFEVVFKLSLDFESIFLKMLLNYLWIFSVIFSFNITFDFSFGFIDQASNPSFFMATNLNCQLSEISAVQLIYIRNIAMIIFILLQITLISFGFKFYSMLFQKGYEINTVSNTIIYLLVSNQAALIKNFGSLIAVRTISDLDYIQGDVALFFYDEDHIKWIFIFILPGLIIFGMFIPFMFFLILFLNKKRFNQTKFRKHLGYLFNEYQKENYFWEQIKIWKRSIIIIIMTYYETNTYVKASLISLTLLCYQVLSLSNKPYSINSLNLLDIQSGQIILISIFLAVVKYVNEQENNPIISTILQIMILLLCLRLCYSFIFRMIRLYIKKYQTVFLSTLYNLAVKFMEDGVLTQYLQKKMTQKKKRREQLYVNIEKLRQYVNIISKNQIELNKQFFLLNFFRRTLTQQFSLISGKTQNFDMNRYLMPILTL